MAFWTLRPHQNASTHDRSKQFGHHDIAGQAAFSKSDVELVHIPAQHVLNGGFHGNHGFLEIDPWNGQTAFFSASNKPRNISMNLYVFRYG